jgi:hypothetical protein
MTRRQSSSPLADLLQQASETFRQSAQQEEYADMLDEIVDVVLCTDPNCCDQEHLRQIADILGVTKEYEKAQHDRNQWVKKRKALAAPKIIEAEIIE